MHNNTEEEKFDVYRFFENESWERVKTNVPAKEAVESAKFYTLNLEADMGITKRVIITDKGDLTVFEWKYGEGVVFP